MWAMMPMLRRAVNGALSMIGSIHGKRRRQAGLVRSERVYFGAIYSILAPRSRTARLDPSYARCSGQSLGPGAIFGREGQVERSRVVDRASVASSFEGRAVDG